MAMNDKVLPVILSASELDIKLPAPPDLLSTPDAEAIRSAIITGGAYTPDGQALIERRKVKILLATDSDGANIVIGDLSDEDKFEDGKSIYIKTSALSTPLSERIQEPRDPYELLRLKHSETCLNAFRDHPSLEVRRMTVEARNEREMPKIKAEVRKAAKSCVSGKPLEDNPDVHHKVRVADKPRKAVDPKNLVAANKSIHKKIHAAKAHNLEALKALAAQEGWPEPE